MTVISNRLETIISDYESNLNFTFKPTRKFFKDIGIGHRRFYQLVRNEVSPTFSEMYALAEYFGVHILELHERTIKLLSNQPTIHTEVKKVDYMGKLGLMKS